MVAGNIPRHLDTLSKVVIKRHRLNAAYVALSCSDDLEESNENEEYIQRMVYADAR